MGITINILWKVMEKFFVQPLQGCGLPLVLPRLSGGDIECSTPSGLVLCVYIITFISYGGNKISIPSGFFTKNDI